jgi:hypothetical protein
MHSGFALGTHFARGVRPPPWYVEAALEDEVILDDLPDGVAGVVIVTEDAASN